MEYIFKENISVNQKRFVGIIPYEDECIREGMTIWIIREYIIRMEKTF